MKKLKIRSLIKRESVRMWTTSPFKVRQKAGKFCDFGEILSNNLKNRLYQKIQEMD